MNPHQTSRALNILTDGEPTYKELVDLYNDLRTSPVETDSQTVSQRALAQIVSEFIDYLDYVSVDLEKRVGLSRAQERERILDSLTHTTGENPIERVAALVRQWEEIERYTHEDVINMIEQRQNETKTRARSSE